jgi:RNA polymerase sigma-70 factor, ECF subfamily
MWPESLKTTELLDQVRAGDSDAINRLIDRHRESVHRLVQMRLDQKIKQRVDVSDVVQDVMIEASRRLNDYLANPVMTFHLWLRQIARDRMIDAHRRHRGSARRSVDKEQTLAVPTGWDQSAVDLVMQIKDDQLTPVASALQKEMAMRVEQAIGRLPDQDAEILIMRHYEQLTNQEVAELLNLTEPAASMRYLRAVRKLKEAMKEG